MDQLLEKVRITFNLLGISKIFDLWTTTAAERKLDAIPKGGDSA